MNEEELLKQAMDAANKEMETRSLQTDPNNPASDAAFLDRAELIRTEKATGGGVLDRTLTAIGTGAAKAGFETKDFIFGEPAPDQKSDIRTSFERQDRALGHEGMGYSLTSGLAQITTGLIGAGKLLKPLKVGKAVYEITKGALAGAVALDPHEERLSDLIESYPELQNPVTDFLQADPNDSSAEGRFKNALESIGVDLTFITALKAIKFLRSGATSEAAKEIDKLEKARKANAAEFGMDFGPGAPVEKDLTAGVGPSKANVDAFGMDFGPGAPVEKDLTVGVGPSQANKDAFGMDFGPGAPAEPDLTVGVGPSQANKDAFGMDFGPGAKETPNAAPVLPPKAPAGGVDPGGSGAGAATPNVSEKEVIREQLGTKPPVDAKGQPIIPDAPRKPDEFRVPEPTDDEIKAIISVSDKDTKAIRTYGSRIAAAEAGHKFAPTTPLPWQKLRATTDVQAFVERAASVLKAQWDKAKGGAVLKDKRVEDLTAEYADLYDRDPAFVLGQLQEAGQDASLMVARMEAALRIGNQMFNDASKLAMDIRTGNLKAFGGDVGLATAELKARTSAAIETMAAGNSILANSGRSLRRARTQFRIKKKDLERINSMDPERLAIIMEKAGGDPKKISSLAREAWPSWLVDEATWHLTNGLLWMWPTHLVNTTTNAFMLAARPTEKLFGSAALRLMTKDAGKRAELSSVTRQALREYAYTVSALADGWTNAVEAFKRGDSILTPHETEFFDGQLTGRDAAALPWKPVHSVIDLAHNAWVSANYRNLVGLPSRTLGAADEFFKTLRYRSVVMSRAGVEAADHGLKGQAAKDYIQKAINQAIDKDTGKALDANAVREAQTVSFQQDLNYDTWAGSLGRGLQNMRKAAPLTSIILPFVKTPVNVIRYGMKLTPGLNLLQKEFSMALFGKNGAEAQAHAMGQMAMGSIFMGLAAHLALNGRMTGSGPDDYKLKQELMATGWKPYSIVWEGEDGKTNYFQLGRFDPVATAMGLVADIVHLKLKNPDESYDQLIGSVGVAVAKNLGEKTFLLNLNSVMDALLDPERKLGKFSGRTAGSMLPFSSLMRWANPDPYLREARTFTDSVMRGLPSQSQKLPKSMDVFGDPIERYIGVVDEQDHDIVEAEHNRIMLQTDKGLGKPDPKFEGVDLRDMTLKDGKNAYERLQELSGHLPGSGQLSLKEVLKRVITSEGYQDLPDGEAGVKGTRLNLLASTVQKYRERAKIAFLRENPELIPLIKSRQREAAGAAIASRKARTEQQPPAAAILKALSGQ